MSNKVIDLPRSKLIAAHSMLRPVREDTVEFIELVDSIREHGILNSLLVREHPYREGYYEIIDGMWRFFASKHLTIDSLPCILVVEELSEEDYLGLQVQANAVSYETRPYEFAEQMQRMLNLREEAGIPMTMAELGRAVGKSTAWVSARLRLLTLCPEAVELVKENKLALGKAVALGRIKRHNFQKEFLEKAPEMNTREFELAVGRFIAAKREEKISGRRHKRDAFELKPHLQSMDSLLMELDRMENISQIIVKKNLTSALEGAKIALEWVLNLHDEGREAQVKELRHKLKYNDRREIIGRQRYEELKQIKEMSDNR